MKKNTIDESSENSEAMEKETVTPPKKTEQGSANPSFPEEYEEQRSTDLRMIPQPLTKNKSGS
ncbi:MAG: hypothetical protein ABIX01_01920 [Chitinophagaceae bacterium]